MLGAAIAVRSVPPRRESGRRFFAAVSFVEVVDRPEKNPVRDGFPLLKHGVEVVRGDAKLAREERHPARERHGTAQSGLLDGVLEHVLCLWAGPPGYERKMPSGRIAETTM